MEENLSNINSFMQFWTDGNPTFDVFLDTQKMKDYYTLYGASTLIKKIEHIGKLVSIHIIPTDKVNGTR
jgi:hypothetical protein